MLDADERAILFLCCENHLIACPVCGQQHPLHALVRTPSAPEWYGSPGCRGDATSAVAAHTGSCHYFLTRKPLGKVGRQEFHALNMVETAFAVVALALAALARPGRTIWLGFGLAAMIVVAQGLWLLPVLDARAETIIQGGTPPAAPWHALYVLVEALKLLALLVTGWLALWRLRSG